jgi:hypothetical protein
MINGRKIPLEEMAIDALNYIDGEKDYFEWKHRKTHGIKGGLGKNIFSLMSFFEDIYISEYCGFYCFFYF